MLENRKNVRKIISVIVILIAIISMVVGIYIKKGVTQYSEPKVIEIKSIAIDSLEGVQNEQFVLEAKETKDNLYEIELPQNVNTKIIDEIENVVLEKVVDTEKSTTLTTEGTIKETEAEIIEEVNVEVVDNKILLTKDQLENSTLNLTVLYNAKSIVDSGEIEVDPGEETGLDTQTKFDWRTSDGKSGRVEAKKKSTVTITVPAGGSVKITNQTSNSSGLCVVTPFGAQCQGNHDKNHTLRKGNYGVYGQSDTTGHVGGGNRVNLTIKEESVQPTITVDTTSCSYKNSAQSVTITANVTDLSSSYYQYYLSTSPTSLEGGSWKSYTSGSSISLNPTDSGEYYLFLERLKNSIGYSTSNGTNVKIGETTYHRYGIYQFDKDSPTITVSPESSEWRHTALDTTITVNDDGGSGISSSNSYQYYLSNSSTDLAGGEWRNYNSGATITLNPGISGTYYLFVKRVNDNAGNASTTNGTAQEVSGTTYQRFGTYQFDYDKPTAGTLTMKLGSASGNDYTNGTWVDQNVYISLNNGSDAHSGHASTTYSLDGGPEQTEPQTITTEGTHTVVVTTTDNVGNTATNTYSIKIDKTAPTVGLLHMKLESLNGSDYTNNTWTNQTVYVYAEDGSDGQSGHASTTYSINGGDAKATGTGNATELSEEGTYSIYVTTKDNSGKVTTSSEYIVKIDKTAPTVGTLTMKIGSVDGKNYPNNTWTNQAIYVYANAGSDALSGHLSTTYSINRRNSNKCRFRKCHSIN